MIIKLSYKVFETVVFGDSRGTETKEFLDTGDVTSFQLCDSCKAMYPNGNYPKCLCGAGMVYITTGEEDK